MNTITPHSFLTLHYRLSDPAGTDLVNTFDQQPATLSMGTGELVPALEQRLLGLAESAHVVFEVPAGEAFGERNPDLLRWVSRALLQRMDAQTQEYQVGEVVRFPTPDGNNSYVGVVQQAQDEQILFDFNHPLAGQAVRFEVQVIGIL